jgi:hypothetical protein
MVPVLGRTRKGADLALFVCAFVGVSEQCQGSALSSFRDFDMKQFFVRRIVLAIAVCTMGIMFAAGGCGESTKGKPVPNTPEPTIMVVSKSTNKVTYFQLTPNVKLVRLKSKDAGDVELIVKNQEPLQIELWTNSIDDVVLDVEFKEAIDPKK